MEDPLVLKGTAYARYELTLCLEIVIFILILFLILCLQSVGDNTSRYNHVLFENALLR
jgi:hypothetical protein